MDEDKLKRAIEHALSLGASYVDVRAEENESNYILIEDGMIEKFSNTLDYVVGFRVLIDGVWGFYAIENPTSMADYLMAVEKACKLGRAYSKRVKDKVRLSECKTYIDKVRFNVKVDPRDNLKSILDIGIECYSIMRGYNLHRSIINIGYDHVNKYFMNSESSTIIQEYIDTIGILTAIAHENGINESTNVVEGGRGGIEMLSNIRAKADYIASMATKLVRAKTVKEGKYKVVMNPDFVALLTHEIIGHPSEADRVLGYELAWAGGAWWAGMLGKKVASELLNVIDDPTMPGTLGHYKYDDEGVLAKEKILIKDGILNDHMYSRETAHKFNREPNGSMRATNARFMPLIRMANTYIKPGDQSYEEMIKEVKEGYLICDMKVPSIDMYRYNWSISSQYAYKIENGEVRELVRDVIVMNNSPDFFKSIDACSKEFEIRPILNCGKGDPMQIMRMGNGGCYIRGEAIVKSST